jgi:alcohol dehydrogenase class IV
MRFEFATAARVVFGRGTFREAGTLAREQGFRRALVVTGGSPRHTAPLVETLAAAGVSHDFFAVPGEPTVALAERGVAAAREAACDGVIALGGGSALDAGKAIAALTTNPGPALDYLEVIGAGRPLNRPPLPLVAIPTTAGTGAEVTRNAVLGSPEHRVKVSLRSALLLPRVALVDPELAVSLPPAVTASTGLDALTQLIEAYVCARPNPLTDALCVEGLRRAARALQRAVERGDDLAAREDMALAALFSGMALANAGLGAVHGFAAPIGGHFPAPHGAVCAALLPHVMAANLRALRERAPSHSSLARYDEVARLLTGSPTASADQGLEWVARLVRDLNIPPLQQHGVTRAEFEQLIEAAARASSMKANPIALTAEELAGVLEAAL